MLRAYSTQHIKWTTEGAVKGLINLSIPQRSTSVICEGYDSILQSGTVLSKQGGTASLIWIVIITDAADFKLLIRLYGNILYPSLTTVVIDERRMIAIEMS